MAGEAGNITDRVGSVNSNSVRMKRGLPQEAPESPVIFTLIMETALRKWEPTWRARDLHWKLNDFSLAASCHADDAVLVAKTMGAAGGLEQVVRTCRRLPNNKKKGEKTKHHHNRLV